MFLKHEIVSLQFGWNNEVAVLMDKRERGLWLKRDFSIQFLFDAKEIEKQGLRTFTRPLPSFRHVELYDASSHAFSAASRARDAGDRKVDPGRSATHGVGCGGKEENGKHRDVLGSSTNGAAQM